MQKFSPAPLHDASCLEEVLILGIGLFFSSALQCRQYGSPAAALASLARPAWCGASRVRTPALLLLTSLQEAMGVPCQTQPLYMRLGLVFSGYGHHIDTA